MQRIPEPELMTTKEQVDAYAEADFSSGDARTVALVEQLLDETGSLPDNPLIVDLGCGPGNITFRLAALLPNAKVIGIDGSEPMLAVANQRSVDAPGDLQFICLQLNGIAAHLNNSADLVVSNSLLHHLKDPGLLWSVTQSISKPGCRVLHRDLRRPSTLAEVHDLQQQHLPKAPLILIHDFTASLVAAYTTDEVAEQLRRADTTLLRAWPEDDRYLVVSGLVG
ncbi:methyltransferase domain-containing protein [bacterium]|nr:methyltransferase domain-containing protein [bacterium]